MSLSVANLRLAQAHAVGVSSGRYEATRFGLDARLVFARRELIVVLPGLDCDGDGALESAELGAAHERLQSWLRSTLHVTRGAEPCALTLLQQSLTEKDGLALELEARCSPLTSAAAHVSLDFITQLGEGHRHAVEIAGPARASTLCYRAHTSFELAAATAPAATTPSLGATVLAFVRMGFEHILSGYDHLAFLFGLALGARRVRSLITMVTAFTLAHSLTLSSAALGWFVLPSWLVEPAIALSVAYVGVENLLSQGSDRRHRLTFLFGLIHGFGFASALSGVELPRNVLPFALGAFNLGVELGQLALLGAALPLVFRLRRHEWCTRRALPGLSLVVAAAGLVWFLARVTS